MRLWILLLGALSFGLVAFGAGAQELRMGVQSAFVVDPHILFIGPNMAMARNLFDSFVGKDEDAHWTPTLAVSWKQIDPLTWEFALRHDVRFSDGSPFTADDVVASVKRIPSIPNNPGPYMSNLRTITSVTAVDSYTVRVTTDRTNPLLPGQFTNVFILSKAMVNAAPEDFSSARATVGTGPFRLVSFRYGDTAILEPNPYYWGKPPPWKRVTIRVIGNDASREAALLAGDLDLIENVPPEDVARLRATPEVSVYARPADRVAFLLPNVAHDTLPLLTDRQVPRWTIIRCATFGFGRRSPWGWTVRPWCRARCPAKGCRRCSWCLKGSAAGMARWGFPPLIRRRPNDRLPRRAIRTGSPRRWRVLTTGGWTMPGSVRALRRCCRAPGSR